MKLGNKNQVTLNTGEKTQSVKPYLQEALNDKRGKLIYLQLEFQVKPDRFKEQKAQPQ